MQWRHCLLETENWCTQRNDIFLLTNLGASAGAASTVVAVRRRTYGGEVPGDHLCALCVVLWSNQGFGAGLLPYAAIQTFHVVLPDRNRKLSIQRAHVHLDHGLLDLLFVVCLL